VLALVALVILAAIAGAIGLGLPGIRIVPGRSGSPLASGPSPSPASASPASASQAVGVALGAELGLGRQVDVAATSRSVDFPVRLPADAAVGPPSSAWVQEGRLSIVWPASAALPGLQEPSIGLLLSEFRGSLDPGYFEKILNPRTRIEPVTVGGVTGWWISGEPHGFVFVRPNGDPAFDSRRIVGDTLIWTSGDLTYRLESALGRDAAIRLAETLR